MISINNMTVAFGGFTLLDNINLHISDKERIGLVGRNGAGKTTLLKLIMKIDSPTTGVIMVPPGLRLGYLPQQMEHNKDKSVIDEAMTAFSAISDLSSEMDEINRQLAERSDYDSKEYNNLIIRLNEINDQLAMIESESPRILAEKTLAGLGFKQSELDRKTSTFSQGWNMRIELAKILLRKPNVLLLDEPTNHLDIESIQWLEDYLKGFTGSLVLISHDRRFLDSVTQRTVEIMLGKIHDYKVPYSKYLILRKERIDQQKAAWENQQRMIEKNEEFIERFRYKPTKSNQVQSRIKQLEKLERIEIDEEDRSALNVKFPPAPRSGQVVFTVKEMSAAYGKKVVFEGANMVIERGEKIAFVGRNGEGKSTMMKIVTGELSPAKGEASLGYNVALGYFAQNQEDILVKSDTVFGTLDRIAVGDVRTKLRDILGAFLFKGEDIDKKVEVLSGGERSRLAMAKLILHPYNLLALDEPTNHMDIRSKDILKQALIKYDGTLLIVSHDRDFLDGLVDKIYEFRDGRVKEHLGDVQNFLDKRRIETFRELEKIDTNKIKPSPATPVDNHSERDETTKQRLSSNDYKLSKEIEKEQRKRKNMLSSCEKKIAQTEEKMKQIEELLSAPEKETDIHEITREYLELKMQHDKLMEQWMELNEE